MLKSVIFKNYRLFKKQQKFVLAPITVLIGKNNTGKSSVLKLMCLLEGAFRSKSDELFPLDVGGISLGNEYIDLVHGKFGRAIELKISIDNLQEGIESNLWVTISIDNDTNRPIIEKWKFNEEIDLIREDKSVFRNTVNDELYFCTFNGFLLGHYTPVDKPDTSGDVIDMPNFMDVDYIGGIRCKPQKYYDLKTNRTSKFDVDGANSYNLLIEDALTTSKTLINRVNEWLSSSFEGWILHVNTDRDPYTLSLKKAQLDVNLTDTGMGITQSIPIIVRSFTKVERETLIVLEEPESHLHPSAHAEIAQLLTDSVNEDSNKRYLIETHSLNFILRIRRLIAEKKFDREKFKLYYVDFDEDNNESNLIEIVVDEGGGVNWWPTGVFEETSVESRAIFNSRLNDSKNTPDVD